MEIYLSNKLITLVMSSYRHDICFIENSYSFRYECPSTSNSASNVYLKKMFIDPSFLVQRSASLVF